MTQNKNPWNRLLGIVFLTGLIFISCSSKNAKDVPVAQVGKEVLFLGDVEREIPPNLSKSITLDEKKNFTRRWVNTELLYLEARRRGLDKLPEVQRELNRVKRSLLANKLLEQEFPEKPAIPDSAVENYYKAHLNSFVRDKEEVRLLYLIFSSSQKAKLAAEALKTKTPQQIMADSTLRPMEVRDTGLIPREQVPQVFAKKIGHFKKGRVAGPLKTNGGFVVFQLVDVRPAGTQQTLQEVRPKIYALLQQEKERDLYHQLLNTLKSKQQVIIRLKALESVSSDSTHRERKGKSIEN